MARIRITLTAAVFSVLVAAAPAAAHSPREWDDRRPPGQARAVENCDAHVLDQRDRGAHAKGGPKGPTDSGTEAPTNCDHYWQTDGFIGNAE